MRYAKTASFINNNQTEYTIRVSEDWTYYAVPACFDCDQTEITIEPDPKSAHDSLICDYIAEKLSEQIGEYLSEIEERDR